MGPRDLGREIDGNDFAAKKPDAGRTALMAGAATGHAAGAGGRTRTAIFGDRLLQERV